MMTDGAASRCCAACSCVSGPPRTHHQDYYKRTGGGGQWPRCLRPLLPLFIVFVARFLPWQAYKKQQQDVEEYLCSAAG